MSTVLDIDVAWDDFGTVLGNLIAKPVHLERDIERLRHALYRQGGVDRRRAAAIFHANRIMPVSHDGWSEFYLEALSDFFLKYQSDNYVLLAESETVFLSWLGDGVSIEDANERRLTLRILMRASNIPDRIERRVLDAVKENLLHESERWLDVGSRSAGVIDALDMHLIRRLVLGAGGQYPRKSSRAAVTFLLGLDQHVEQFVEPNEWRQLLIGCIASLLAVDQKDGSEMGLASVSDLEGWIKLHLDDGYSSEDATCLQDDILSAMRRMSLGGEHAPTDQQQVRRL